MASNEEQRYLERFDHLDLSNKTDRRIGVVLLKHYFSTVMADISRKYLERSDEFKKKPLWKMWEEITHKFLSLEDFNVPEEFDGLVPSLNELRKRTEHNPDLDPTSVEVDIGLKLIRQSAPEWSEWMEEKAKLYQNEWNELTAKAAMIELARDNLLHSIKSYNPRFDRFDSEVTAIHEEAEEMLSRLDELERDESDVISKELVEIQSRIQSLLEEISELKEAEVQYEIHLEDEAERMREMRRTR